MERTEFEINLPDDVQEIMSVISEYGATSYVVGGCVRDSILGREPHDWDICTPALPGELLVEFEEKGYKVIPTGLQHGTITVHLSGNNYEITTFRRDGEYSDGRHPDSVEFTSDLIYDLERRDFTINAIAYNPEELLQKKSTARNKVRQIQDLHTARAILEMIIDKANNSSIINIINEFDA